MPQISGIIRCVTKNQSGFGHLRRSLLLAQELRKKKCNIFFIIDSNPNAKKLLTQNNFNFFQLKKNLTPKQEYTSICKILKKNYFSFIVLDTRERNEQLSKYLLKDHIFTVVIDDAWCKHAYAHIMFNPTIVKRYHNYLPTKNNLKIYVGPKFFITNKNFSQSQKKNSSIKQKDHYTVTISMGGYDKGNLAYKFTKSLSKIDNISLQIILGPYTCSDLKFERLITSQKNISIIKSPEKIWKIFNKSDVVISNAGSTLYELFIQKIPTIYCATEKHQIPYAKNFKSSGFGFFLGFKKQINYDALPNLLNKILLSHITRRKISQTKKMNFDGLGTKRISDIILNQRKIFFRKIS